MVCLSEWQDKTEWVRFRPSQILRRSCFIGPHLRRSRIPWDLYDRQRYWSGLWMSSRAVLAASHPPGSLPSALVLARHQPVSLLSAPTPASGFQSAAHWTPASVPPLAPRPTATSVPPSFQADSYQCVSIGFQADHCPCQCCYCHRFSAGVQVDSGQTFPVNAQVNQRLSSKCPPVLPHFVASLQRVSAFDFAFYDGLLRVPAFASLMASWESKPLLRVPVGFCCGPRSPDWSLPLPWPSALSPTWPVSLFHDLPCDSVSLCLSLMFSCFLQCLLLYLPLWYVWTFISFFNLIWTLLFCCNSSILIVT